MSRISSAVLAIMVLLGASAPQAMGDALIHTETITPEKACNPDPAPDDLVLPMPCGGKFVLRPVVVHANGILSDYEIKMGLRTPPKGREYYEAMFPEHISAPFMIGDLPVDWQKALQNNNKSIFYYFIGKYEVSTWQWNAVMNDTCSTQNLSEADLRPRTEITWYELQAFLGKYNAWLIKEHKTALPAFQGGNRDIGFLRIPTEEEWEFAARGGANVSEENRNQEDFYPLKEYGSAKSDNQTDGAQGKKLRMEDFAVYQSDRTYDKPAAIGSRKPNPLLIYDMAGNVRELVDSRFRFSIADKQGDAVMRRLHGSTGGMVCKGGSFLDSENAILPGWREEVPLLNANGLYSARNLGFRPVLSGINFPSSQVRDSLIEEAKMRLTDRGSGVVSSPQTPPPKEGVGAQPHKGPIVFDLNGNPATELDKIIIDTASPDLQENLAAYRKLIAAREEALNRDKDKMLLGNLRNLLFEAELISEESFRMVQILINENKIDLILQDPRNTGKTEDERKKIANSPDLQQAIKERMKKMKSVIEKDFSERDTMLLNCINKYKEDIEKLSAASDSDIKRHLDSLRQEYKQQYNVTEDRLSKSLVKDIDAIQRQIGQVQSRGNGIDSLTKEQVKKDFIPQENLSIIERRKL